MLLGSPAAAAHRQQQGSRGSWTAATEQGSRSRQGWEQRQLQGSCVREQVHSSLTSGAETGQQCSRARSCASRGCKSQHIRQSTDQHSLHIQPAATGQSKQQDVSKQASKPQKTGAGTSLRQGHATCY